VYSTCIFCHSQLGKNESVEHFPVGRKLAFDGAKGRLWVVCARCGRWNLTPLEERWEAIEECEREYRGTRLRASTDQIGLARLREGTDLIRIGSPLRPEFAAWRYAKHFKRRRQAQFVWAGAGVVGAGTLALLGVPGFGLVTGAVSIIRALAPRRSELGRADKFVTSRVLSATGQKVWQRERVEIRIIPSDESPGWGMRFAYDAKFADFTGREALHAAQIVSPAINAAGASQSSVKDAVRELEAAASPDEYFRKVLRFGQGQGWRFTGLKEYPEEMRLAFEMASHEESERRALDGELDRLEQDWKEAEEIAAIADNLFLPKSVTDWMERHRG
jgi:hypothetical protein